MPTRAKFVFRLLASILILWTLFTWAEVTPSPGYAQPAHGPLQGITALAGGFGHTCALNGSGGVICWGYNSLGQLGDGTTVERSIPVGVSGLSSGVIALAAGGEHTCALTVAGGVKCWGDNSFGQLGDGTTTERHTPVDVSGLSSGIKALTAGSGYTCAVTDIGGVKCWGNNNVGELGDGTTTEHHTPVNVSGLSSGVKALAARFGQTCALTSSGGVKCWGRNDNGQLGDGTTTERHTPVNVSGLSSGVSALAAGSLHTCAVTSSGGVKCWGGNFYGQLGDGTTDDRLTPVDVSGLNGVSALAGGFDHTCALINGGGVKCWGNNNWGQLGDGTTTEYHTPVNVSGLSSGVNALATGYFHTCAVTGGGRVKCWGDNSYGQLGKGTTVTRLTSVSVSGLSSSISTLAAGGLYTCAVTASGGVKCWGDNSSGQLGDGATQDRFTPVNVSGLNSGISTLAAGFEHICTLTSGGGVKCWGDNSYGQLGDGTTDDRLTPVDVSGLSSGVSALVLAGSYACALTSGGGVKCWGNNFYGQLGDGTTDDRLTPVDVSGLSSGVSALAASEDHTCVLTSSRGVKCWGHNNWGQLGDGTTDDRLTPVDVSGLSSGVNALAAGEGHTCALTSNGGVKCWGSNFLGQLGDGTAEGRLTPVDVSGLSSGVSALVLESYHTCALISSGGIKCWGYNGEGQLGDGTTIDRLTPVNVSGLSGGVSALEAGTLNSCALTNSGGVKCWGQNNRGQLGDGTTIDRFAPIAVSSLSSGVSALAKGSDHTCALTESGGIKCWGYNSDGQLGNGEAGYFPFPVEVIAPSLQSYLPLVLK